MTSPAADIDHVPTGYGTRLTTSMAAETRRAAIKKVNRPVKYVLPCYCKVRAVVLADFVLHTPGHAATQAVAENA